MSELASRLANLGTVKKGPSCEAGNLLDRLAVEDPEGHAELINLLFNTAIPASVIVAALTDAGYSVSLNSMRRHRKRGPDGCACP